MSSQSASPEHANRDSNNNLHIREGSGIFDASRATGRRRCNCRCAIALAVVAGLVCCGAVAVLVLHGGWSPKKPDGPSPAFSPYSCESDLQLGPVAEFGKKGLCLDDTTFSACANEIPSIWPNTQERIRSLRLFAPWKKEWSEDAREPAWNHLKAYVEANDAQVLLGCEITCDLAADAQVWEWTKQLISLLGSHRIMGLAIGNEMDLLWMKTPPFQTPECISRLWNYSDPNSFLRTFLSRVEELDKSVPGFQDVPVTSVWSTYCYAAEPFIDNAKQVMCKSFFQTAIETFGPRFVFSFNIYPYFDNNNQLDPGTKDQCQNALNGKLCFNDSSCFTNNVAAAGRKKISSLTSSMNRSRDEKYRLWIGESGWSYPISSTTQAQMKNCPQWGAKETFLSNYNGWLTWDLNLTYDVSVPPADHVFFFTMRDSLNFGETEHFGLIAKCGDSQCKLQQTKHSEYSCESDLQLGPVKKVEHKGLCMDDTTFSACAGEIPAFYPNTKDRVTSLRLFAPWKSEWPEHKREAAWDNLKSFVEANDAKVLLGCEITCNLEDDAKVWAWTKQLISKLGSHRLMGLAIGNEMDLLWMKKPEFQNPACLKRLWSQTDPHSFVQTFLARIEELDKSVPGFKEVPVTTVWSAYCFAGEPFVDNPHTVTCKSFFEKAIAVHGNRYVFSFNIYPYFDPGNRLDPGTNSECQDALKDKLCFNDRNCFTNKLAIDARHRQGRLLSLMKRPKDEKYDLWIGESGWSHPISSTTQWQMKACPDWGSKDTFMTNYNNWLTWDLNLTNDASVAPADHVFFFTMRDSLNFGEAEHFGLIARCSDARCKLQNSEVGPRKQKNNSQEFLPRAAQIVV